MMEGMIITGEADGVVADVSCPVTPCLCIVARSVSYPWLSTRRIDKSCVERHECVSEV